jgi:hypothetical protein
VLVVASFPSVKDDTTHVVVTAASCGRFFSLPPIHRPRARRPTLDSRKQDVNQECYQFPIMTCPLSSWALEIAVAAAAAHAHVGFWLCDPGCAHQPRTEWVMDHTLCYRNVSADCGRVVAGAASTKQRTIILYRGVIINNIVPRITSPRIITIPRKSNVTYSFQEKCLLVVIAFTKSNSRRDARSYRYCMHMADPSLVYSFSVGSSGGIARNDSDEGATTATLLRGEFHRKWTQRSSAE